MFHLQIVERGVVIARSIKEFNGIMMVTCLMKAHSNAYNVR